VGIIPAAAGSIGTGQAYETFHRVGLLSSWTDWSLLNAIASSFAPVRFSDLGVPEPLSAALERSGITIPFPIQAATLPDCHAGRDVCGKAPTGAGKTLAFGLAIMMRLAGNPVGRRKGRRHPSALVLVPTRELAAQIAEAIAPLAAAIGAQVASIYGGVGYAKQLSALRRGVDVVIACPGRLTDLIERGAIDLSYVDMVVVDEADRMADMGFLPAVRRLLDKTSPSRQTLLFSATLDGAVDQLIRDYQHDPVRHDVEPTDADRGDVSHHFWRIEGHDRVDVTAQAVSARGPAVVFCRTKRGADRLSDRLARSGLASAAIHSSRTQNQRERAIAAFRAGRLDVLVATDIAARGIHVDAVPLVVHFDPAGDDTDYVHRSGRTGRAGADGTVLSLIGSEHLAATKHMQRRLGLPSGVSSPDVPALSGDGGQPRLSSTRAKTPTRTGVDADRRQGGLGDRTARRNRPPRHRGRRATRR
jgi:superfamily II DNA/RNA helicase